MEVHVIRPDESCFEKEIMNVAGHGSTYLFDRVEYTDNKGILLYYKNCTFPKHGFPFPEAITSINVCKRIAKVFIKNLNPLKFKKIIPDYCRIADNMLVNCHLKDERLCPVAKEIKKLLDIVLEDLKIDKRLSYVVALMFEYDDAYRFFFQDIMSSLEKKDLLKLKTYWKIKKIIKDRCIGLNPKVMIMYFRVIFFALLIPRIRKSLKKALVQIDFSRIQFDEYDSYWVLNRNDWNFMGKTHAERLPEWIEKSGGIAPKGIEY